MKKNGTNRPRLTQVCTQFDPIMLEEIDRTATRLHISRSELLRRAVVEYMKTKSSGDDADGIEAAVMRAMDKKLSLDDVRTITANNTERLAGLIIKLSRPIIANLFIQLAYQREFASKPGELESLVAGAFDSSRRLMAERATAGDEVVRQVMQLLHDI